MSVEVEHVIYKNSDGSEEFGRIQSRIGDRLIVRKGGKLKVISKDAIVGHRLAASWGVGQDEEFSFHGFQSRVTLWEGGKEYRGRVLEILRSGECLVEFRDESGSRRTTERFQDELVLHRRVDSSRGNEKRAVGEDD